MSWIQNTLTSSIGRKLVMSITGLFLVVFLVAHLVGNVSLLMEDGAKFNEYAHLMKHNPLIILSEVVLFAGFIAHIVQGILLERKNRGARTQQYAVANDNEKVSWTSKYMGPFGIIILLFLGLHLYDFFRFKYLVAAPMITINGVEMADLHPIVHNVYKTSIAHLIIYPLAMIIIGLHLSHGFQSAFRSLGLYHVKYTPAIIGLGTVYAIVVPALFAIIPIFVHFGILF